MAIIQIINDINKKIHYRGNKLGFQTTRIQIHGCCGIRTQIDPPINLSIFIKNTWQPVFSRSRPDPTKGIYL
jgi:hypothetical protein